MPIFRAEMHAISSAVVRFQLLLAVTTEVTIIQHLQEKKNNYTTITFVNTRHKFFISNMTMATRFG